jgi:hypothetical protein
MAHFAKINLENKIIAVLTLDNSNTLNDSGTEEESIGQQYLEKNNNWPANMWVKTSYNTKNNQHTNGGTPFRGNYATIGGTWDSVNQIFWPPKPYNSWIQDLNTANWVASIAKPELTEEQKNSNVEHVYEWNEQNQSWDLKIYS